MQPTKKIFACALPFVAGFLLFSGCSKKPSETARTLNIGIQPSAAFIPLYVVRYTEALEKTFAANKQNVRVVWQDFQSGPPMNASLQADLTDVGVIGDVPTVLSLAGGTHMKLAGIPARGADAYALLSRADDSSISSYRDLRGKRIATVFGSTGHNLTKKLLEKAGLGFSDIEFININTNVAEDSLLEGEADAVVIWEPNVTRLVEKGSAKIVAQGSETDLRGTNAFVVREEYMAKNSGLIRTLLAAYAQAASQLEALDGELLEKLSAALAITPEQLQSIISKYDFSVAVTPADAASLQDTIRFLVSIDNLSSEYQIEDFIDTSCLP